MQFRGGVVLTNWNGFGPFSQSSKSTKAMLNKKAIIIVLAMDEKLTRLYCLLRGYWYFRGIRWRTLYFNHCARSLAVMVFVLSNSSNWLLSFLSRRFNKQLHPNIYVLRQGSSNLPISKHALASVNNQRFEVDQQLLHMCKCRYGMMVLLVKYLCQRLLIPQSCLLRGALKGG